MRRTYHGSCHCGAVKFAVAVDLAAGTVKCNCSICGKGRAWWVKAEPGDLTVISGGTLADYTFGSGVAHHLFCSTCGIRPFEYVSFPPPRAAYVNVSVSCLDDMDLDEVLAAPVRYEDGRHDAWDRVPDEVRHL
jgi:hypothetical protein